MRKLLGLLLFLSVGFSQITDKNFKSNVNGGVTLAIFESDWQEQPFDKDIIKGISGYEDCEIIYVKSEEAPKATKKLRLRKYLTPYLLLMQTIQLDLLQQIQLLKL